MRGRFLRRVGCGLAVLVLFISGLFTALAWLLNSIINPTQAPGSFHPVLWLAAPLFLLLILIGIFTAVRIIRRAALPFGNLLDAAGRIADGDYAARVPEHGPREVRSLAGAFNSMAERLEVNDQERRRLLADVTHELRTPITVIQGNLEGMLDGIYPADPDHLQSLLDETHMLSYIIDDLRTLSLTEAGALQLQLETGDMADLVEDTVEAFRPLAQRRSVTLRADLPPDLPEVEVDPARIREVLANLLSNALRYTPPGGEVQLRVEVGAGQPTARRVRVSVQDSGSGIAPADLPHIFDRFYKSADSRGSGLGLAIAKSLVTAHGGEIEAESQPGKGTTITFTIPVKGS